MRKSKTQKKSVLYGSYGATAFVMFNLVLFTNGCLFNPPSPPEMEPLIAKYEGGTRRSPAEKGLPVFPGGEEFWGSDIVNHDRGKEEPGIHYLYRVKGRRADKVLDYYMNALGRMGWKILQRRYTPDTGYPTDPQHAIALFAKASPQGEKRVSLNVSTDDKGVSHIELYYSPSRKIKDARKR